jgi:RNA methyltransferase, TrmH family
VATSQIRDSFHLARRDRNLAVLEGFHTLKHAIRFGAGILEVAVTNWNRLHALAQELAPDVIDDIEEATILVTEQEYRRLSPHPHPTGVIAIAERVDYHLEDVLADESPEPIILLDQPRNLANVGASVRVAAAASAKAVLTTGDRDPWDPSALRGSAGLHFATPVLRVDDIPNVKGEVIAIDPEGDELEPEAITPGAILLFGSERYGLDDHTLAKADRLLSIPMAEGVSSLNLATSVAAVLYINYFAARKS